MNGAKKELERKYMFFGCLFSARVSKDIYFNDEKDFFFFFLRQLSVSGEAKVKATLRNILQRQ